MRILFDNGTPRPSARVFIGHVVTRARQIGWYELGNGLLIARAEAVGYDLLLSTDKNIRHQQNLTGRKIAIIILGQSQWPMVQPHLAKIAQAVNEATPDSYGEIEIPLPSPCHKTLLRNPPREHYTVAAAAKPSSRPANGGNARGLQRLSL
jgi:hypothetical protein